jgi:hypothetical protein
MISQQAFALGDRLKGFAIGRPEQVNHRVFEAELPLELISDIAIVVPLRREEVPTGGVVVQ